MCFLNRLRKKLPLPPVLWHCWWASGRASDRRPVKQSSDKVLAWLSVCPSHVVWHPPPIEPFSSVLGMAAYNSVVIACQHYDMLAAIHAVINHMYTVKLWIKKGCHTNHGYNFVNSQSICKILSLVQTALSFQQKGYPSHLKYVAALPCKI